MQIAPLKDESAHSEEKLTGSVPFSVFCVLPTDKFEEYISRKWYTQGSSKHSAYPSESWKCQKLSFNQWAVCGGRVGKGLKDQIQT